MHDIVFLGFTAVALITMYALGYANRRKDAKEELMKLYGKKRRGNKLHPHNECDICSESDTSKSFERFNVKRQIDEEVKVAATKYPDEIIYLEVSILGVDSSTTEVTTYKDIEKRIKEIFSEGIVRTKNGKVYRYSPYAIQYIAFGEEY